MLEAAQGLEGRSCSEGDLWPNLVLSGSRTGTVSETRSRFSLTLPAAVERNGGRCVECGGNFDLQYDHILPFALGGATTVENLQLLCSTCNQEKSDSL
jgi:5-methylcytosine-specific restriction endonuclease McrA